MRIYHFGNFYMSSIQQGIQAAHCQTEMSLKYTYESLDEPDGTKELWHDWARYHKTMICLSGGMDINLQEIKQLMAQPENPYPWADFNEAQEAMAGMLTNVAIVLPEDIYEMAKNVRSKKLYFNGTGVWDTEYGYIKEVGEWKIKLIELLNSCGLAR